MLFVGINCTLDQKAEEEQKKGVQSEICSENESNIPRGISLIRFVWAQVSTTLFVVFLQSGRRRSLWSILSGCSHGVFSHNAV